jgi:hypothetical protein
LPAAPAAGALLKVIPSGPISAELAPVGQYVYAGCENGELLRIDSVSLEVRREQGHGIITALEFIKGGLTLRSGRPAQRSVSSSVTSVGGPVPPLTAYDPLYRSAFIDALPEAWRGDERLLPQIVFHDGGAYRTGPGGAILCIRDGRLSERNSPLGYIEGWRIALTGIGSLGFARDGVYALDEDLSPRRHLVKTSFGPQPARFGRVDALAADHGTIAFISTSRVAKTVQVWTADGQTKLREESAEVIHIMPLPGGYVATGYDVLWIPMDPTVPATRFTIGQRHAWPGRPRLAGGRLFVASAEGGIHVFDPSRFSNGIP